MYTDPAIARIRNRTPLFAKVAVSKTFDLAEEVALALERLGHNPEWMAEKMGIPLEDLVKQLSGLEPIYDPIARMEAALGTDLFVGIMQRKCYFNTERIVFSSETIEPIHVGAHRYKAVIANSQSSEDSFDVAIWHNIPQSSHNHVHVEAKTTLLISKGRKRL